MGLKLLTVGCLNFVMRVKGMFNIKIDIYLIDICLRSYMLHQESNLHFLKEQLLAIFYN